MLKVDFAGHRLMLLSMVVGLLGSYHALSTQTMLNSHYRKFLTSDDINTYTFHDGIPATNGILMSVALDSQTYAVGSEIIIVVRLKNSKPDPVKLFLGPVGFKVANSLGIETPFVRDHQSVFRVYRYDNLMMLNADGQLDFVLRLQANVAGSYTVQTYETIREENPKITHLLTSPPMSFSITDR